jgi:hypothetical protein
VLVRAGVVDMTGSQRDDQEATDKKHPATFLPSQQGVIESPSLVKKQSKARLKKDVTCEKTALKKGERTSNFCPIS